MLVQSYFGSAHFLSLAGYEFGSVAAIRSVAAPACFGSVIILAQFWFYLDETNASLSGYTTLTSKSTSDPRHRVWLNPVSSQTYLDDSIK